MMSTAGYLPARCSRPAHLRRRHPLLPPSLLLLLASAFCWKGAAGQQISCYASSYIRHSASTESFFEALSGDGVDFWEMQTSSCSAVLPGFNAVLAHLHGDADGDSPTMGCSGQNKPYFPAGAAACTAGVKLFNDKLNSGTIDELLTTAGLLDDATKSKSFDEKLTIWAREVPVDAYLEKAQANFQPFTPASISEKVQYATTLAAFEATGPSNAAVHEVVRRLLAMEDAVNTANDNNAILDRLTTLEETKATQDKTIEAQGQTIADLKAALQSKASTTDVADKFAEVDAKLVRIEGIRRERAADAAAAAAAGSKTPGTAGSNTGPQAGIADQPTAADNDDDNAAAGSTDGTPRNQTQPQPTQADDGAGHDGAQPTSLVGPAVGAAVAVFFLAGVAGYCCMKRKEEKERDELALARSRRAPTRNNPTFDVGGAHGGEEEVAAEPTPAHSAARTAANAESSVAVYIEPNLFQAEVYDASAAALNKAAGLPPQPTYATIADDGSNGSDLGVYTAAAALNKAAGLPPQPTYATIADDGSNGSDLGVYTEPNPLQAEAYDTAAAVAAAAAAAEEANSKSSGDDFCANHLPTGVRPRAATTTAPLPDDGAAPAEYDVLEPGYVYADLKGGQQTYGSTGGAGGVAGQGVPSAEPRKVATYVVFEDAFGGGGQDDVDDDDDDDDDLEI